MRSPFHHVADRQWGGRKVFVTHLWQSIPACHLHSANSRECLPEQICILFPSNHVLAVATFAIQHSLFHRVLMLLRVLAAEQVESLHSFLTHLILSLCSK